MPVAELDRHKPKEVATLVEQQLERPFNVHHHTRCWQHYDAHAAGERRSVDDPFGVLRWRDAFEQYTYTDAWVAFLPRRLLDDAEYRKICLGEKAADD